ncbi:MAG: chorismate synthase [Legionellaceae bacterium]|nr:chorismate synthase [Legionellaceae bacterium]
MSGNTLGTLFTVTSFGESHGPVIGCVVDGCPPRMKLSEALIQPYLDKRKPGASKYTSQRREPDKIKIMSGVYQGLTTGTPIMLLIENLNQRPADYHALHDVFRPGHADFTYHHKYGHRDPRGGGRASARETAARVAAGAIAELYLSEHYDIEIIAYLEQMGDIKLEFESEDEINHNPFFCPNTKQIPELEASIDALRREGSSVGARVGVMARGMPIGLGDPVFDKLDATLAHAMMSINAVKGVEIGAGFDAVTQKGHEHRDEMNAQGFLSNHAGGILGGISTGQDLKLSLALKPTSSIVIPGRSLNTQDEEVEVVTKGRHDPCVGMRAVPVARAMMALVLIDHILRHKAQNKI